MTFWHFYELSDPISSFTVTHPELSHTHTHTQASFKVPVFQSALVSHSQQSWSLLSNHSFKYTYQRTSHGLSPVTAVSRSMPSARTNTPTCPVPMPASAFGKPHDYSVTMGVCDSHPGWLRWPHYPGLCGRKVLLFYCKRLSWGKLVTASLFVFSFPGDLKGITSLG